MINFYNNLPIITIRRHSKHENFTKIHFYLIIFKGSGCGSRKSLQLYNREEQVMKVTLNAKIITLFVIAGLLPFIITGVLSYEIASKSLRDQSFNQLVSVRDIKKKQIEEYFEKIGSDISALSEDPTICNAMKEMKRAFHEIGAEKAHDLYVTKIHSIRKRGLIFSAPPMAASTAAPMQCFIRISRLYWKNVVTTIFF